MELKEKVKNLPSCPGVYLMKDSLNSIIYVGKSKNLKSRIGSYFQNSKSHPPKVVKLVKNLKDFEYLTTDTEFEAFLLECKLIKQIKPIYNKLMKSPKSYTYIKVNLNISYPSIEISNAVDKNDANLYFGPYTQKNTVQRALDGIKESCKILCNSNFQKTSSCLNYSLGLCIGMCFDISGREQYLAIFDKIIKLLNGTDKSILDEIEYKMVISSQNFDFENAAKYRDYLKAVNYLLDKNNVVKFTKENKNIILIEYLDKDAFKVFLIKGYKILFKEKYSLNNLSISEVKGILKNKVTLCFDNTINYSIDIGNEEIDESQIIYAYLNNKSNNCKYIIIPDQCVNSLNNTNIDNILNELLP
ncbi:MULTISPECIES: GIY-YIG nuclease family protein [unclassified Clostridium]|uniref:GIY-YIG nuclease family protein n=1 Tax=unclassified Clostridium TaxID=2614128 RepID=UPI0002976C7D|nr:MULTISPECIES: GIY-YIG nuclease family protein [unclassified Clostridium]EKQ56525.1 MAG: putative endonuclease [Clostridium sp. Maddingley MBC34-26]